jgi:hypothetical protein
MLEFPSAAGKQLAGKNAERVEIFGKYGKNRGFSSCALRA